MNIEALEAGIGRYQHLKKYYESRSSKLKRTTCLLLHRCGLLKPFSFVQWISTYSCNLHCPYCEASAGKPGLKELEYEEVKTFIDDLKAMGVKRLVISGGEPLVRKDILEIMEHAHKRNIALGLVTNGYLVEEMWDRLRGFDYFLYFTSMDGMPAYHDRMRGKPDAFSRALKGLTFFRSLGVPMQIVNTVVYPDNIDQLPELLEIVTDSGAERWHLTPAVIVGRAAQHKDISLKGEQLRWLLRFINTNKHRMKMDLGESHRYIACFDGGAVGKPFFCGAGLTRCSVMPSGEVMGCHQTYDLRFSEGSIREKAFPQIWREGFLRYRQRHFNEPCRSCSYLHICQGGCRAEMERGPNCLKSVWHENSH